MFCVSFDDIFALLDKIFVLLLIDKSYAWSGTSFDLVEEARTRSGGECIVGAVADEEGFLQLFDHGMSGKSGSEGSVVGATISLFFSCDEDLREGVIFSDEDVGEGFVVTKENVVSWFLTFYEVHFEKECF